MSLEWDPEVESPATIAVIGGGPIGLEAAIYGRFLGYFVTIFEQRRVAHRMLDWHQRPLAVTASQCTTKLGHAAIAAQYPDYVRRPDDHIYTGQSFADEYLLPLAKTDLLFDDIHFLSPVSDVSRLRTLVCDSVHPQERCNDEFRIVVEGRHRGNWISRADIVIDCRGMHQQTCGMGPGGGLAMGERALKQTFLTHTPLDRKFEVKMIAGKKVCLVGQSIRAVQFATEFAAQFSDQADYRLTWIIRSSRSGDSEIFAKALSALQNNQPSNIVILEVLGVDQVDRLDDSTYKLRLMRDDDSVMELQCDVVVSLTQGRCEDLSTELKCTPSFRPGSPRYADSISRSPLAPGSRSSDTQSPDSDRPFMTHEPGLYGIRAASIEEGAGVGLADAHRQIRDLYALIAGRADLDLYTIVS
jgi:hypothetical protein